MTPVYEGAVTRLKAADPALEVAVAVAGTVADEVTARVAAWPFRAHLVQEADKYAAMKAATVALATSGTVSTELALAGAPMVIAYRQSSLTWALMRSMLYLPYVGMPNILAGERLVPELLQGEATPGALAGALLALLRDTAAQKRQIERFTEFHHLLRQNTAEKAADAVLGVLHDPGLRR